MEHKTACGSWVGVSEATCSSTTSTRICASSTTCSPIEINGKSKAEADAKPELEIYADDVICAHGATVGELDETQLFYLISRGISRDVARAMLIAAFLDDAVDMIENADLAASLRPIVTDWMLAQKRNDA